MSSLSSKRTPRYDEVNCFVSGKHERENHEPFACDILEFFSEARCKNLGIVRDWPTRCGGQRKRSA